MSQVSPIALMPWPLWMFASLRAGLLAALLCGAGAAQAQAQAQAQTLNAVVTAAGPAAASSTVSAADSRAVRAVVEAQLKAFAAGQAEQAFSYAAPAIRKQMRDAKTFMALVRENYAMLIRPTAVSYFRPVPGDDGAVTLEVQFRDTEGQLWRAVYELQRQPDKRWRISGCAVAPDDERSTT